MADTQVTVYVPSVPKFQIFFMQLYLSYCYEILFDLAKRTLTQNVRHRLLCYTHKHAAPLTCFGAKFDSSTTTVIQQSWTYSYFYFHRYGHYVNAKPRLEPLMRHDRAKVHCFLQFIPEKLRYSLYHSLSFTVCF